MICSDLLHVYTFLSIATHTFTHPIFSYFLVHRVTITITISMAAGNTPIFQNIHMYGSIAREHTYTQK